MIKHLLAKALLVVGIFATSISFAQSTFTIQVGPGNTNTYSPANVTCTVGDTIKFVWVSGFHPTQSTNTTTIPLVNMDGSGGTSSEYKIKMLTAGSVPYECTAHGGMGGTITVNAPVSNSPILTDNFNYTIPDTLSQIAGSNWIPIVAVSNVNKIPATAGLSYPTSSVSNIGNAALIKNTGQDIGKAFPTNIRSGSVYASFLINVSAANTAGEYFFAFLDSALNGSNYRARTFIKSSGTGFRIGVSKSGVSGVAGYNPTDLNFGTTYQIVVKYSIIAGATNDSVKLFVNPVLGATEPTATSFAVPTENDMTISSTLGLGAVALRQGTASSAPTLVFDGLLVGQTWSAVTPLAVVNPSVKFNPTTLTVNENAGTATVTLNVTNANSTATSVDVKVKGGTATAGSDYTFTTQTVTFPASSTTAQSFTIPIIDDATQETDETIELVLRNTTNAASIEVDSVLTITIPANDITNPVVNFVAPYTATKEEGTSHIFSVAITSSNANATGVKVYVKSTSTASSTDYAGVDAVNGLSLTFPGGSSANQSENINIIDDAIAENAETVVLVLRDPTNSATIGNDSIITITIPRNDQPLVAHFIGTSGNVNENAGEASITIMAMGATTSAPTSFDVVYKSGTATSGADFTYTTQTVTIPAAKDSNVVIKVNILDDTIFEQDETIVLAIRNITNNGEISTDSIYTLTIKNDDILFKNISALKVNDVNGVSVLKDSSVYIKGIVYGVDMQGTATSLQYTLIDPTGGVGIFRSGANNPPIISLVPEEGDSVKVYGKVGEFNGLTQVNMDSIILVSKGNALKAARIITTLDESTESDLVQFNNAQIIDTIANSASGTTLRIVSGTDSMDLRIDADVNLFGQPFPSQKFNIIGLGGQFDNSNPKNSGYQLLPRSINDVIAIVTPNAGLDSTSYSVSEGAGTKVVKVKLSSPATETVTVKATLTGGSATFTQDYQFTNPTTLTIPVGQSEGNITFTIINDNATETNETITFTLSDPTNCILSGTTTATITIVDNDPQGININKQISLNLYPNPAKESFKVVSSEVIESINIVNIIGQSIITINSVNATEKNINVDNLSSGVYNVIISTKNGNTSKRLVIE